MSKKTKAQIFLPSTDDLIDDLILNINKVIDTNMTIRGYIRNRKQDFEKVVQYTRENFSAMQNYAVLHEGVTVADQIQAGTDCPYLIADYIVRLVTD